MPRQIDLAMLPAEAAAVDAALYILVDQLRATTTIATLFGRGLARLIAVADVDRARAVAARERALLFGEVGGLPPEGFDSGNSPAEAATMDLAGETAVLVTTNGTRALCCLASHGTVAAGSLANLTAVVAFAATFERVCVVCAGNAYGARFALEDFGAAAAITALLAHHSPEAHLGDAARLAVAASGSPDLPVDAMTRGAAHAHAIAAIGLAADIDFSLVRDSSPALPLVTGCGDGWAELRDANLPA